MPASGTRTFIKNYNFLFHGCYEVPKLYMKRLCLLTQRKLQNLPCSVNKYSFFFLLRRRIDGNLYTLKGIMGNQGKIARTQSSKKCLFLLTFRLSYLKRNFSVVTSLSEAIDLGISLLITVHDHMKCYFCGLSG